ALAASVKAGAALAALPQGLYVARYARDPEVTPAAVEQRLDHWLGVARRLQLDRRPRIVDHDMGGMLYFGGDLAWIRDTRGLVDLPFALYGNDPDVVRHELFGDRPFDMAHAHAATGAALNGVPAFRAGYVEIPGYGDPPHGGQFLRRDLLLDDGWTGPSVPIRFANGVAVRGIDVPSPEIAAGSGVYVELGVDRGPARRFRLVAFLAGPDGVVASWDLPPAYDWVPIAQWRPGEVFHGRFSPQIPDGVPEGFYDLGLVLFDDDGVVPAIEAAGRAALPESPVFARGEVVLPGLIRVVSRDEMARLALDDKGRALTEAKAGRCDDAEGAWTLALRHRTRSGDWRAGNRPPVARAIARCFAHRAAIGVRDGEALLDRIRELEHARDWDTREAVVWDAAVGLAADAHARAIATRDPIERFQWAEAAVRADPRRSWDRRLAERTRRGWIGRPGRTPDHEVP
ncbi:MAG: hypothetical protein ABMB14_36800, partial [Myxococcota bacterium]